MKTLLSANPDFYASLVFYSSDLVSILSPEGVYKYVSNSALTILGYEPEYLVGRSAIDFIHPDDLPIALEALQKMQHITSLHLPPFRFRARDGSWHWVDCVLKDMSTDLNANILVSNARDITEKVEAQQQLSINEAFYSSLFINHPDAVFTLNMQGIFEKANKGIEQVLGLPLSKIIGRPYTEFVWPAGDNLKFANEAFVKTLNGEAITLELEAINQIKGNIWLSITTIPVILNKQVVAMHGIAKDVTAIKKAQVTIKEQADLLGSVFSSITEGLFVVDKQWRIKYANPFFITFFGLQIRPFIGEELWQLLPELKASRFYEVCCQAAETNKTIHADEFISERRQFLRFAIYPFSGGYSIYFDDATLQKKKEQELLDLSLVASRITNGVVIMNPEGRIEWVNDGFSRLTGYSREEAIGQIPGKLLQGPATDPQVSAHIYNQYAAQVPFSEEVLNYKKSGEIIWFHIDVTPVFDETGKLIKYVAIENDITELKQKETEMVELTENLLRRNEDLQQFTYMVSHNLRAPVANLLGLNHLLQTEGKHSARFEEALNKLSAATNHLDMVIADLNKILSPLKKANNSPQEQVNVYEVVCSVVSGLQEQLESIQAVVTNSMEQNLALPGRKAYFYSIFNNLITNAIKYRKPDLCLKIRISAHTEPKKITILFADNGIGMDLEQTQNQLFQLYRRFHPGIEGRGVGLYLVKSHTEAMGGSISVDSAPGHGTTFFLTFNV